MQKKEGKKLTAAVTGLIDDGEDDVLMDQPQPHDAEWFSDVSLIVSGVGCFWHWFVEGASDLLVMIFGHNSSDFG